GRIRWTATDLFFNLILPHVPSTAGGTWRVQLWERMAQFCSVRWPSGCCCGVAWWAVLRWLSWVVPGGRDQPVLRRWVAALCLLGPVFESGRAALQQERTLSGQLPDPGTVATGLVASTAACLFWELTFPEAQKGKGAKQQQAKAMFMRVVRYSAPDALHLGAAFVFLSLAVICEMFIPYYTGRVVDILRSQYEVSGFLSAIGLMALFSLGRKPCLSSVVRHQQDGPVGGHECERAGAEHGEGDGRAGFDGGAVMATHPSHLCGNAPPRRAPEQLQHALAQQLQDCKAEAQEVAASVLGAVRTVRSFGAESREAKRYQEVMSKMHRIQKHKGVMSAVHLLLRRMVTVGVKVLMLYYGRRLIGSGQLTSGGLLSFVLYQKDMGTNVKASNLVYICGEMLNSAWAAGKVFEYLDRKPLQKEAGQLEPASLKGHLTFRNVTFCYPTKPDTPAPAPALKGVSLEVHPGKMTALVGPSGGGKTSCVSLLERFYEPQEGEVLLDGLPLHSYRHQYLHGKMAMVSQDPVLFSGSVRDNIAYGLEDCSMEMVTAAARKANAHGFICQLEQGYDTGAYLLCTLTYTQHRYSHDLMSILILDEATSCMDLDTQLAMQQVVTGVEGQTVLVVAHRLKTVEEADHILFLEDGSVVEQGTHQQLMAKRGRYHRLKEKLFADLDSAEDSLSGAHGGSQPKTHTN
ncbi:hypothetical protein JZ751_009104, partial [Albula glossodonta]